MTIKKKSIKKTRGVKTVEVYEETHKYLKIEAAKKGLSLLEFCEELIKKSKTK